MIVVDCSASMGFAGFDGPSVLRPTKLDRALELAGAIGATVLHQQDSAGVALSNDARSVPMRAGRLALHDIVARLETARPAGDGGVARAFRTVSEQPRRPDLVVALTDALDPVETLVDGVARLRHGGASARSVDVAVLQILTDDEMSLEHAPTARFVDPESDETSLATPARVRQEYVAQVRAHVDDLHYRLTAIGARHALHRTSQAPLQALVDLLAHEGAITR